MTRSRKLLGVAALVGAVAPAAAQFPVPVRTTPAPTVPARISYLPPPWVGVVQKSVPNPTPGAPAAAKAPEVSEVRFTAPGQRAEAPVATPAPVPIPVAPMP